MYQNISWGKIGVLVVAIVGIGALGFVVGREKSEMPMISVAPVPAQIAGKSSDTSVFQETKQIKVGSEVVPLDEKWNKYTNYTLGFSLNIPNWKTVKTAEKGDVVYIYDEKNVGQREGVEKRLKGKSDNDFIAWEILIKNARGDSDIDEFIKNRYGSKCAFDGLSPATQAGLFDVEIKKT